VFRYFVRDDWHEALAHDANGHVGSGSVGASADAFSRGCQVKVAIRGLCRDFEEDTGVVLDHEVFIPAGSCYYYTQQELFIAGTNPLVRVRPAIPLRYRSQGWDFGWCVARTDGRVVYRAVDPHALTFRDQEQHCSMRWFVR
jgi:hypothetical protein